MSESNKNPSMEELVQALAEAQAKIARLGDENAQLKAAKPTRQSRGWPEGLPRTVDYTTKNGESVERTESAHLISQGGPWATVAYIVSQGGKRSMALRKFRKREGSWKVQSRFNMKLDVLQALAKIGEEHLSDDSGDSLEA